jgi:hypothetical protein
MKYIQLATGKNAFDASKVDIRIMGNTYDVKEQLKAMGAEYDGENREWTITVEKDIHAIWRRIERAVGACSYRVREAVECRDALKKALKLSDKKILHLNHPVGYPAGGKGTPAGASSAKAERNREAIK